MERCDSFRVTGSSLFHDAANDCSPVSYLPPNSTSTRSNSYRVASSVENTLGAPHTEKVDGTVVALASAEETDGRTTGEAPSVETDGTEQVLTAEAERTEATMMALIAFNSMVNMILG